MRSLCMPFLRQAEPFILTEAPMSAIFQEGLLDPVRLLACTYKWLVSPTFLLVLFSLPALLVMPVGFV